MPPSSVFCILYSILPVASFTKCTLFLKRYSLSYIDSNLYYISCRITHWMLRCMRCKEDAGSKQDGLLSGLEQIALAIERILSSTNGCWKGKTSFEPLFAPCQILPAFCFESCVQASAAQGQAVAASATASVKKQKKMGHKAPWRQREHFPSRPS